MTYRLRTVPADPKVDWPDRAVGCASGGAYAPPRHPLGRAPRALSPAARRTPGLRAQRSLSVGPPSRQRAAVRSTSEQLHDQPTAFELRRRRKLHSETSDLPGVPVCACDPRSSLDPPGPSMPRQRELSMPIPRWQKPATKYYDNNYSFGMNFYQPMIDWLDDRDRGLRPRPPPHLPWLNERGLKKYDPSQQGIKTYSAGRAEQLAVEAQLRAQESLRETKEGPIFHPRSPFSLAKQVEVATSLTKKVLGHSSYEERHADKYLKEKELADLRRRTEEALLDLNPRRIMATTDLESSSYRAKSRRAIANELIMESMRHLQDSRTEEQIRKAYSDTRRGVRTYQTPYWYFPWSWEDPSCASTSKYLSWERPRYDYSMAPWACEYPLSYRYLGHHKHSYDSCRPIRSYTIRYCPCFSRTVV